METDHKLRLRNYHTKFVWRFVQTVVSCDAGCCLVQFDWPRGVLMFRRNFCLHFVPEHGGKNFPQMLILCTRMHCVMLPCCLSAGYCRQYSAAPSRSVQPLHDYSQAQTGPWCSLQPGRHTVTVGTRVQIQVRPCGICGEQIRRETVLSPEIIGSSPVSTIHNSSTLTISHQTCLTL